MAHRGQSRGTLCHGEEESGEDGSVKSERKKAAGRINAAKATAANIEKYTTDRRKEAAKKA